MRLLSHIHIRPTHARLALSRRAQRQASCHEKSQRDVKNSRSRFVTKKFLSKMALSQRLLSEDEGFLGVVSGAVDTASTAVATSPFYVAAFGPTSLATLLLDWVPLAATVIAPILCLFFVLIGLGSNQPKQTVGTRMVKRVGIAIRADVRIIKEMSSKKLIAATSKTTTPKDVESGKKVSPVKGKAEEAAIKNKAKAAEKPGGKGGRFY